MADKRTLRLKVTMCFGGQVTLIAGDYTGDNIPEVLENEFQAGSPHVEEVVTKAVKVEDVKVEDEKAEVVTIPVGNKQFGKKVK